MKQKEFYDLAAEMEEKCGDWENKPDFGEIISLDFRVMLLAGRKFLSASERS